MLYLIFSAIIGNSKKAIKAKPLYTLSFSFSPIKLILFLFSLSLLCFFPFRDLVSYFFHVAHCAEAQDSKKVSISGSANYTITQVLLFSSLRFIAGAALATTFFYFFPFTFITLDNFIAYIFQNFGEEAAVEIAEILNVDWEIPVGDDNL